MGPSTGVCGKQPGREALTVGRAQVMTPEELAWVDAYHAEVREKVAPRLEALPEVLHWLEANTAPLGLANGKPPKVCTPACTPGLLPEVL